VINDNVDDIVFINYCSYNNVKDELSSFGFKRYHDMIIIKCCIDNIMIRTVVYFAYLNNKENNITIQYAQLDKI
jgi:hypothetical protein